MLEYGDGLWLASIGLYHSQTRNITIRICECVLFASIL